VTSRAVQWSIGTGSLLSPSAGAAALRRFVHGADDGGLSWVHLAPVEMGVGVGSPSAGAAPDWLCVPHFAAWLATRAIARARLALPGLAMLAWLSGSFEIGSAAPRRVMPADEQARQLGSGRHKDLTREAAEAQHQGSFGRSVTIEPAHRPHDNSVGACCLLDRHV
jgi:hypothetical protein